MLTELQNILDQDCPPIDKQRFFLSTLFHLNNPKYTDNTITELFIKVKTHFYKFIEDFKNSAIPELDFKAFTLMDILKYFYFENEFAFKLNKSKGKGILYGLEHTLKRQKLLNNLPDSIRISVINSKFQYYEIFSKLLCLLEEKDFFDLVREEDTHNFSVLLKDIKDIGMAHSLYLITLQSRQDKNLKKLVIKQEELPNQAFYCRILSKLGWPSFKSMHFESNNESWEISSYLGDQILGDLFHKTTPDKLSEILPGLAAQAALGDILGRGDRHYENYILQDQALYPIDISYLFWPDNEDWIKKYLCGGISEFCVLKFYLNDKKSFKEKSKEFFEVYEKTFLGLKKQKTIINNEIINYYGQNQTDTLRKISFVEERLNSADSYIHAQKQLYLSGFSEMAKRQVYTKALIKLGNRYPSILEEDPLLKMYYYADKDRSSSFFLLENLKEDLLKKTKVLAEKHLGYQPGQIEKEIAQNLGLLRNAGRICSE
ncbi:hypothetical protein ACFLZV_07150 [Candidatus Margulisiibacteriota bacterium]